MEVRAGLSQEQMKRSSGHLKDGQSPETCGCIEDTMTVLHTINKGAHMNTSEKFHIHEIKQGMHLNYTFADMTNPIFDTLIQACRRKQV
jgi:hypothetical protein